MPLQHAKLLEQIQAPGYDAVKWGGSLSVSRNPRSSRGYHGMGLGFVTLHAGRQLAAADLARLRTLPTSEGGVLLSPPRLVLQQAMAGGQAVATLTEYSTDALYMPPTTTNCVLALLMMLLGTSLAALGAGRDSLVVLNPKLVSNADVAALLQRARLRRAPLGAVQLRKDRNVQPSWAGLLSMRHGVLFAVGFVLQSGTYHRHAVGFNAGASLLFLNPWVVVVQEADRAAPAVFGARMEQLYGIFLSATSVVRRIVVDPRLVHGSALPVVGDVPSECAVAGRTASQKRREAGGGRSGRRVRRKKQ